MVAARAGQVEVVRRLVEAGADTTQVRQEEEEEGRGAHRSTGREREGRAKHSFTHSLSLCVAVTVGPVCGPP